MIGFYLMTDLGLMTFWIEDGESSSQDWMVQPAWHQVLTVAASSGGGGTSNDMPWRDKDEDFLNWARRAMQYAHAKQYPGNRFKRSLSK